ncbi:MAG TPA: CbiX/SirB N-terminal domain-containing protein [Anaerolineales bacterium]|nr:CbiX/SirB N-terminal domain-containing protein [Anaerolineales bacterium]
MSLTVVLAMHGAPANDFPSEELAELMGLHAALERATGERRQALESRHSELEAKLRTWPRTERNDPFWAGSHTLAEALREATGHEVIVGFNEFCAPSLDQALDQAAARGMQEIVVVTPMMTRGGEHSEADIPGAIERAVRRHPAISFRYAWPFNPGEVARFLAAQLEKVRTGRPDEPAKT